MFLPSSRASEMGSSVSNQQSRKQRDSYRKGTLALKSPKSRLTNHFHLRTIREIALWCHLDAKEAGKCSLVVYPGRENRCNEHLASLAMLFFP